jgi:ABC-2 type transport system ATP-binding protein
MNAEVIRTENLSKYYGRLHAVQDVSLSVGKGEIYGFLGLNGAGKTTTIRMLLGMIRPTKGAAFLKGRKVDPGKTDLWKDVGYLVEMPYSYPALTVKENLEIARRLHLINNSDLVNSIIDILKLNSYKDVKAKNLSSGNAQRLGIAKALLHHPEILILDEPANGLDPAGIVEIRELLLDLALNQGKTVFISSHILGEIARLATRIGIIHEGNLIQEVDTDKLDQYRKKRLLINTPDNEAARPVLIKKGHAVNAKAAGILEITNQEAVDHPEGVSSLLVHAGFPPSLVLVEEEDLESYFLRIIGVNGGMK